MLFPELRNLFKRTDAGELLTLGLDQKGVTFTPVSVGEADFYRKYPEIYSILAGGLPSWSGESVSIETALQHPVVWACNGLISRALGFMPALLMQSTAKGKREATEHPMYAAMRYSPNEEISAQSFSEMLTSHCLLQGDGYAHILRRSGTGVAIGLNPLLPGQVDVGREKTGQKRLVYVVKNQFGAVDKTYTLERGKPHDILHLRGLSRDGITGISVIETGRNSIGTALAAERNVAGFWANGGRTAYLLEMVKAFKDEDAYKKFRDDWDTTYSVPHKAPILENGTTYKQIGSSMVEAQAIEFRLAAVAEICRWFNISPSLVGDASRATLNNQEQYALQFKNMTLNDWTSRWGQDFRRCVLTPEEQLQGYILRHDEREFLRGDFATQMAGFATALQNGYLNIDEVRDEMDYNPLPNGAGSHHHVQINMGTLAKDGQIQPATSLVRLDTEGAA